MEHFIYKFGIIAAEAFDTALSRHQRHCAKLARSFCVMSAKAPSMSETVNSDLTGLGSMKRLRVRDLKPTDKAHGEATFNE